MVWLMEKLVDWWQFPFEQKIVRPFQLPLHKRIVFTALLDLVALVWAFVYHLGSKMTMHILIAPIGLRIALSFVIAAIAQSIALWIIWRWAVGCSTSFSRYRLIGNIIAGIAASLVVFLVTALLGTIAAVDAVPDFTFSLRFLVSLAYRWTPSFIETWRPNHFSITALHTCATLPLVAIVESYHLVFIINVLLVIKIRTKRPEHLPA